MGFDFLQKRFAVRSASDEPLRVGMMARPVPPVPLNATLGAVLHALRVNQVSWLPVLDGVKMAGLVTEAAIAERVAAVPDLADTEIILGLVEAPDAVLDPGQSLADAAAVFTETGTAMLPVLTWDGRYLGCLKRIELAMAQAGRLYPPRVGGMATPLGVYLTTGAVSGGVGVVGLVLAGMALAAMLWVAQALLAVILAVVVHVTHASVPLGVYNVLMEHPVAGGPVLARLYMLLLLISLIAVYLIIMRLAPRLAGYHAAEHQTVNAMEAGEDLKQATVARMPRVHPRCGTNLVALAMMSMMAFNLFAAWLATRPTMTEMDSGLFLLLAGFIVILFTWRRVGGWMQQHYTTRPATPRELDSGIAAGEDVVRRHLAASARPTPTLAMRIWRMGLLQAFAGALLASFVLNSGTELLDRLLSSLIK